MQALSCKTAPRRLAHVLFALHMRMTCGAGASEQGFLVSLVSNSMPTVKTWG